MARRGTEAKGIGHRSPSRRHVFSNRSARTGLAWCFGRSSCGAYRCGAADDTLGSRPGHPRAGQTHDADPRLTVRLTTITLRAPCESGRSSVRLLQVLEEPQIVRFESL